MAGISSKDAFKKAIFNTANISGLAAVFLSYSMGSLTGTFIFAIAVLVGSFNKYQSVLRAHKPAIQHILVRILQTPALTAQILMLAAFINFIKSAYNGLDATPEESSYFFLLSLAWFFGLLGDDALRRNDRTNFSAARQVKVQPLWVKSCIYVTRNPVFFYLLTNLFFAWAIFVMPDKSADTDWLFGLNVFAVSGSVLGICYGLQRGIKMMTGRIMPHQTNNGVTNFFLIVVNLTIGLMALMQGLPLVVISQLLFSIANIICLFETHSALTKEKHF